MGYPSRFGRLGRERQEGADGERSFVLTLTAQMDINLEAAETAHRLGLDGISIELCFVSQYAHRRIDMARISLADAGLALQLHFFPASRIFFAEYLRINGRLPVHSPG